MEGVISKKTTVIKMDRISQLPEPIIQQILSHLDSKESARTGFLSKSLFNAWSTRPVLDFDIASLNHNCMELVLISLRFYQKERLPLHKFKLHIKGPQDEETRLCVFDTAQNWFFSVIKLALSNGIVELDLSTSYFGLPFQHKDLKWCNLKKLKLKYIPIDNHSLSYMISSCPLLTYLHLERCQGLNKIIAQRIPNLREFYLICTRNHPMMEVDFSAPKLESFKSKYVEVVHIDEGTSVKNLSLTGSIMKQEGFQRLLSSSPFLEDLRINWCRKIETLAVSSHSIKFLRLKECYSLYTVDIDAPNLQLLEYISRYKINSLPFVISRAARKAKCCNITYSCENDSALNHYATIRQLMTTFQSTTLTVQSASWKRLPYFLEKLSYGAMTLQPIDEHYLEGFTLVYCTINEAEIEGFLQVYRPKYFICDYLDSKDNHSGFNCRCWRHYIKETRICHVVGNEQKPLTKYERTSLSTTVTMGTVKVKISFSLEWKLLENNNLYSKYGPSLEQVTFP